MDKRLKALALVVAAAVGAWMAWRQRPVQLPEPRGSWEPVDR